jgi:hypothetical protein
MDSIHNLQTPIFVPPLQPLKDKAHITHSLSSEPQPNQRIKRKTRIANPTRSIIPIPRPAYKLGERKGGGSDDRAGGLEDE